MTFPSFNLRVNTMDLLADEYLIDSDSTDGALLTMLTTTALQNKKKQFQEIYLDNMNSDPDPDTFDQTDQSLENPSENLSENETPPRKKKLKQTEANLTNCVQDNRNKNTAGKKKRETDIL